jgi:hypothetical protein
MPIAARLDATRRRRFVLACCIHLLRMAWHACRTQPGPLENLNARIFALPIRLVASLRRITCFQARVPEVGGPGMYMEALRRTRQSVTLERLQACASEAAARETERLAREVVGVFVVRCQVADGTADLSGRKEVSFHWTVVLGGARSTASSAARGDKVLYSGVLSLPPSLRAWCAAVMLADEVRDNPDLLAMHLRSRSDDEVIIHGVALPTRDAADCEMVSVYRPDGSCKLKILLAAQVERGIWLAVRAPKTALKNLAQRAFFRWRMPNVGRKTRRLRNKIVRGWASKTPDLRLLAATARFLASAELHPAEELSARLNRTGLSTDPSSWDAATMSRLVLLLYSTTSGGLCWMAASVHELRGLMSGA